MASTSRLCGQCTSFSCSFHWPEAPLDNLIDSVGWLGVLVIGDLHVAERAQHRIRVRQPRYGRFVTRNCFIKRVVERQRASWTERMIILPATGTSAANTDTNRPQVRPIMSLLLVARICSTDIIYSRSHSPRRPDVGKRGMDDVCQP